MKKLVLSLAAVLFAVALWPLHALAAAYPDHPITVIVPYTPGGNVDMLARGIAPAIEEELGVKLIITPHARRRWYGGDHEDDPEPA